jgi:hypothetical protein
MESLKLAYERGFQTSVSCEPMLDTRIDRVVEAVRPFVTDAVWLGRVNQLRQALAHNCPGDQEVLSRADQMLEELSDDFLRRLYTRYQDDPMIKYKDSIKEVVGLERPTETGLDV